VDRFRLVVKRPGQVHDHDCEHRGGRRPWPGADDVQHQQPGRGRQQVTSTRARGCAGSASGEPITSTIEVANGTNSNGNVVRSANSSIKAIAAAPPATPAT
jgi:hypothetical protein